MQTSTNRNQGFALFETAMVVIIIGLLVGVLTSASDLRRAAQVRSVVADVINYKTVINAFKMQYHALPGDIDNATEFWSSCTDDGSNTCNGNGDGVIQPSDSEGLRAWQHLSLAGLIPSDNSGILDDSELISSLQETLEHQHEFHLADLFVSPAYAKQPKVEICHNDVTIVVALPAVLNAHLAHGDTIGSCEGAGGEGGTGGGELGNDGKFTIGYNIPAASRVKGGGYKIDWNDSNLITFASERPPFLDGSILTAVNAWSVDSKIDDSFAASGYVISAKGEEAGSGCVDDNGYFVDGSGTRCQMHFWLD